MDMLFLCMPRDFLFDSHFKDLGGAVREPIFFLIVLKVWTIVFLYVI